MRRTWPLRIIQASPLIVLTLILGVWFAVPVTARSIAFSAGATDPMDTASYIGRSDPTVMALSDLSYAKEAEQMDNEGVITPPGAFGLQEVADMVTAAFSAEATRFAGSDGALEPGVLDDADEVISRLLEYEQETGGTVAVFAVPSRDTPPVALSSIANTSVLTAAELAEFQAAGTLESLRRDVRQIPTGPLSVDIQGLQSGMGNEFGGRYVAYSSRVINGHVYEVYGVFWPGEMGEVPDTTSWTDLSSHQGDLDTQAKRNDGALFVIGPVDAQWVALRPPAGLSESEAARVDALVEKGLSGSVDPSQPLPLTADQQTSPDGAKWAAMAISTQSSSAAPFASLVFLGISKVNPEIVRMWSVVGDTPTHRVQVWLIVHLPLVMGALGALLLASLIAAPLAFVWERRQAEAADIERERERVQLQARERVVERLTGLSEEMDRAASRVSGAAAREAASVSADIDQTVTELKRILGDLPQGGGEQDE